MDSSRLQVSLNHDAFDLRTMKMKLNSTLLACSWRKARPSYLNSVIHSSSRYTFIRTKNIEWSRLTEKNTKFLGPTKWTRINPLVHQMNQIKLHSFPRGPVSVLGASKFPEETLSYRSNQSFISSYDVVSITCTFRFQQEFQFLCVLINAESRPADAISRSAWSFRADLYQTKINEPIISNLTCKLTNQ